MAVTVKPDSDLQLALRLDSKLGAECPVAFGVKRGYDGEDRFFLQPGRTYFAGRVVSFSRVTVRVMSDEWADEIVVVIAFPNGAVEEVNLGYSGYATFEVDASPELLSKVETHASVQKKLDAGVDYAQAEAERLKPALRKGGKALAVKGRKVAIGTEVSVFWSGTTYNKFNHTHEHRLGVRLPNGATEWVSAANFEPLPSPAEVAAYAASLKVLDRATLAALEGPKEEVSSPGRLTHAEILALMPARVLAREMVRDAFGDEAVAEREEVVQGEHERLHEAEYRQEVQMGDG